MCHGFGVLGEAVSRLQRTFEEHCFSEDSETVAQRDCVVESDQREGPGEFSCTHAFGAIRSAPDPATLPYWALTAGHRMS